MTCPPATLALLGVSKRFPGTAAVTDINLQIQAGEVHAVVGENGAGKSTLMKTIAGAFKDYSGEIFMDGQPVQLRSPAASRAVGIGMIHQELSLAPPLSIAENILAGRLPTRFGLIHRKALLHQTRQWLAEVGLSLHPLTPVEEISPHESQLIEIAKALSNHPRILVMDEPTSALSQTEVERLFAIIGRIKAKGLAILYISHHLHEVFRIADQITVLRDGRKVSTQPAHQVSRQRLVEMMVGGTPTTLYTQRASRPGHTRLEVENLSRIGFFHHCSFHARAGEILGIAGLSGSGRTELARTLCAIDPRDEGRIRLDGQIVAPRHYQDAIKAGFAYLTEDRKALGLALRLNLRRNIEAAAIPAFAHSANPRRIPPERRPPHLIDQLQIHPPDPTREVATLSGGNQQKALLAKWLATNPQVLILDEPTRGVDVGAKAIIHQAIAELADQGRSVLLISSDLPELVGLSDRTLIMRHGRLIGEMPRHLCSEESILLAVNGELPGGSTP